MIAAAAGLKTAVHDSLPHPVYSDVYTVVKYLFLENKNVQNFAVSGSEAEDGNLDHPGVTEAHQGVIEDQPGVVDANLGFMEPRFTVIKAHCEVV
jgi:hypothetical protein